MGYLTTITGQNIDDIVRAGQGLAYVVYPFAVTTLKWAPVWSILFFIMMLVNFILNKKFKLDYCI